MYLDFLVKIPEISGKITFKTKKRSVYVEYEYARPYNPLKKYNVPRRVTIGKQSEDDKTMMRPNHNYKLHFPDAKLPDEKDSSRRSSCLRVGAPIVIQKIIDDYDLEAMLSKYIGEKDAGLLLDIATYSIIAENNAAQYYPEFAYNHPLMTEGMRIYSDSKVSDFLRSITVEQSIGFLNEWNESRDHREKIYISYDSTNKNCQAGNIEMVEFGHAKKNLGLPIFNYSIAYDTTNRIPLFYEEYAGSIVDVSQLKFMLEKAQSFGYKRVGFILDRGYFSRENIQYMDSCGYDFVIMAKGMASFVSSIILQNKGKFENSREHSIRGYKVYGTTVKHTLYGDDEKYRHFHLFYSSAKECAERESIEANVERMANYLKKYEGKKLLPKEAYAKYFELIFSDDGTFLFAKEKADVIEQEINLCGYFVIVTSRKMTAKEAIELYKSRDGSEKLFRGDKSYLGNKSLRVYSDESGSAKIFIEFIALIIRCKLYVYLKDEMVKGGKKSNYMTVPAAIKELEKIEMVRLSDRKYHLDHAVTAVQKAILGAFGLDADYIKRKAQEISDKLSGKEQYNGK